MSSNRPGRRRTRARSFSSSAAGSFPRRRPDHPGSALPFLARGYTVFAAVHGSQPRFIIPEIEQDLHRATRWIRQNATRWNVNPDKFAVFGASAGGHLSLTLGTQGGPGPADAKDPVDRASSAVQAVALLPPDRFLQLGRTGRGRLRRRSPRQLQARLRPALRHRRRPRRPQPRNLAARLRHPPDPAHPHHPW